jgi:hypothetical protein
MKGRAGRVTGPLTSGTYAAVERQLNLGLDIYQR